MKGDRGVLSRFALVTVARYLLCGLLTDRAGGARKVGAKHTDVGAVPPLLAFADRGAGFGHESAALAGHGVRVVEQEVLAGATILIHLRE